MRHYQVYLKQLYPYQHNNGFDPDTCSSTLQVVGFRYQAQTYSLIFRMKNASQDIDSLDLPKWLHNNSSYKIICEGFGPNRYSLLEQLVRKEKIANKIIRKEN